GWEVVVGGGGGWVGGAGARGGGGGGGAGEPIARRGLQPVREQVADLARRAIGDDCGGRRQQEGTGAARDVSGPRDDGDRGILESGDERDERKEGVHGGNDIARSLVQRPVDSPWEE